MGYYFIGVREAKLVGKNGSIAQESKRQIKKTAEILKKSKIADRLPEIIYSNGSCAGNITAELLANLLGIKKIEINKAFDGKTEPAVFIKKWFGLIKVKKEAINPVKKMNDELTKLENNVSNVNIAVCSGKLFYRITRSAYKQFKKLNLLTRKRLFLRPAESFISEQHDDWGFGLKYMFPSRKIVDTLV